MSMRLTRRDALAGLVSTLAAGSAWGRAPLTSLRPVPRGDEPRIAAPAPPAPDSAAEIIGRAGLSGEVAYAVADAQSGQILEARGAMLGLPPASVAKAVTALYALDCLGAAHRFETRLVATAPINGGILRGDLILVGGGDPVLDTGHLAVLAEGLKAAGLRELRGRFLVDGSALPYARAIDPVQPVQMGYNPSVSGLALNFNRVHFQWQTQEGALRLVMDAPVPGYRPEVQVARMRVADRSSPVFTYRDAGNHDAWSVARGALSRDGARWLPVRKGALYAGEVLAWHARSMGIVLPTAREGVAPPGVRVLSRHLSPPLHEILRGMLKYSTNITAEMCGMAATTARFGRPSSIAGSAMRMSAWARQSLNMEGAALVDHSGLGDASRVSAAGMCRALVAARDAGLLRELMKDHVLRKPEPGRIQPVQVKAKTGTLHFVSSLAGYAALDNGRELAFAIFTADTGRREGLTGAQLERPQGARGWNTRSRVLQQDLIERWAAVHGA